MSRCFELLAIANYQVQAIANSQLVVNRYQIVLDRPFADPKLDRSFIITCSLGNQRSNLSLAFRECVDQFFLLHGRSSAAAESPLRFQNLDVPNQRHPHDGGAFFFACGGDKRRLRLGYAR